MPFRSMISTMFWLFRGKSKLSADYTKGKPALTQNKSRLHAFRGLYPEKACLFTDFSMGKPALTHNNSRLHAFLRIIPWKSMPFCGIIRGKFWLSENYTLESRPFCSIIHRKFRLSADNLRKVKLRARISPRIRKKIFLDVHQGPVRCWLLKKKYQKISCYSPFNACGGQSYSYSVTMLCN